MSAESSLTIITSGASGENTIATSRQVAKSSATPPGQKKVLNIRFRSRDVTPTAAATAALIQGASASVTSLVGRATIAKQSSTGARSAPVSATGSTAKAAKRPLRVFTYDDAHNTKLETPKNIEEPSKSERSSSHRRVSSQGNLLAVPGRQPHRHSLNQRDSVRIERLPANVKEEDEEADCHGCTRRLGQIIVFIIGFWYVVSTAKRHN